MLLVWLLIGFANACFVRYHVGPMRVSRWVTLAVLGPVPPAIAFLQYLNANQIMDRRI